MNRVHHLVNHLHVQKLNKCQDDETILPSKELFASFAPSLFESNKKMIVENKDSSKRYQFILDREICSDIPFSAWDKIHKGKNQTHWLNNNYILLKDPLTMTVYSQLIFEQKPQTIIEFGTFTGASALHMESITKQLNNNKTQIYTFDVYKSYNKLNKHDRNKYSYPNGNIHFKFGDVTKLEKTLPTNWYDLYLNFNLFLTHYLL